MSDEIEWGVSYGLILNPVSGYPGRLSVSECVDRAQAEEQLAAFLADRVKWRASMKWRTAAVQAGPWQDGEPPSVFLPVLPPSAPGELPEGYIFSFNVESPLGTRYVALKGDRAQTRLTIEAIFEERCWAEQRDLLSGTVTIRRHGWTRLVLGVPQEEGFDPVPLPAPGS